MKASGEDGGEGVRVGGPGRASQSIPPWATRRRSVASLVVGPGSRSTWRLGSRAAAKGGGSLGGSATDAAWSSSRTGPVASGQPQATLPREGGDEAPLHPSSSIRCDRREHRRRRTAARTPGGALSSSAPRFADALRTAAVAVVFAAALVHAARQDPSPPHPAPPFRRARPLPPGACGPAERSSPRRPFRRRAPPRPLRRRGRSSRRHEPQRTPQQPPWPHRCGSRGGEAFLLCSSSFRFSPPPTVSGRAELRSTPVPTGARGEARRPTRPAVAPVGGVGRGSGRRANMVVAAEGSLEACFILGYRRCDRPRTRQLAWRICLILWQWPRTWRGLAQPSSGGERLRLRP